MKIYKYGGQEVVVTDDTVVVPRDHFEMLLMEHISTWRKHMGKGVFENIEETAHKIIRDMEDVSYALLKESNAIREAKRAQLDIPF